MAHIFRFAIGIAAGGAALAAAPAYAGTITAAGSQTAGGGGRNAQLSAKPVTLPAGCTITKVSGDNEGFWTEGARKLIFNDQSAAVGTAMPTGTYRVYPNLRRGAGSASVQVVFTCP